MEQPSPSNERLSSISLVNVDDFHTNCQEMTTRTRRIRQNNLINNYYQIVIYIRVRDVNFPARQLVSGTMAQPSA
jgi:hypothetical protein